jgi:hypothetical protein
MEEAMGLCREYISTYRRLTAAVRAANCPEDEDVRHFLAAISVSIHYQEERYQLLRNLYFETRRKKLNGKMLDLIT